MENLEIDLYASRFSMMFLVNIELELFLENVSTHHVLDCNLVCHTAMQFDVKAKFA